MKTIIRIITVIVAVAIFTSSCQNDELIKVGISNETIEASNELKFARILSKAVAESEELRNLLKKESLKKIDNDHNVLYQLIRDQSVDGLKVHELLAQYANNEQEFATIENSMPLLTILVPTLPNFSPETWDSGNEIPLIAVRTHDGKGTPVFEKGENEFIIPTHLIPGYPILVVKQNERIRLSNNNQKSGSINSESCDFSFEFIDEAYDGTRAMEKSVDILQEEIEQQIIDAYDSGVDWHRDHIYYGLTLNNDKGAFREGYSEYLTSFRFSGERWYSRISDQDDPSIGTDKFWTDGAFEFKVELYINSTNGLGTTITKYFSAYGYDIMEPSYTEVYGPRTRGSSNLIHYYEVNNIEGKTFNPNIELVPWNLKHYSVSWKLSISEEDDSQEITTTEEITSQFATNFEISGGEEKKTGYKFGASYTTTNKSSFSIKTKMESDELGDAVLNFGDPIIISKYSDNRRSGSRRNSSSTSYTINEISVSNDLHLVVMPLKRN